MPIFLLDFGVDCVEELRRKVLSIVSLTLIPNEFLQANKQPSVKVARITCVFGIGRHSRMCIHLHHIPPESSIS